MMSMPFKLPSRVRGFSLVEIMVGVAIGMIACIVVLQVFAASEGKKRTSTSGADAQSTGAIVVSQLSRDISEAGYGFAAAPVLNCNLRWSLASGTNIANAVRMVPVMINPANIPAADLNTDVLLIMYGSANGVPEGVKINDASASPYRVEVPASFAVGDRVIAAPDIPTPDPCASSLVLDRVTAVSSSTVTAATATAGAFLFNLGQSPAVIVYAIRGGNLTMCDYLVNDCGLDANKGNPTVWVPIAPNIVGMKALYVRGAGATPSYTVPANNCEWMDVNGISLALVARSSQFERDVVTTTAKNPDSPVNAPTWLWNANAPLIANTGAIGPDQAADEPWKHYRYKVFQTSTPIRNISWIGRPSGC